MRKVLRIICAIIGVAIVLYLAAVYFFDTLLPQNEYDVPIVERTLVLLSDETAWNRNDDRNCGPEKQGTSLYCALRQASIEVAGEFKNRAAAVQQVRFAIERQNPHIEYDHRLIDYNNDPETSFEDMQAMLRDALESLRTSEPQED